MVVTDAEIEVRMQQAIDLLHAGRLDEAQAQFETICKLRPTDPKAWHFRGTVSALRGAPHEAERCLREAIAHKSPSPHTYYNLARILADRASYAEAVALLEEAIARKPDFAEAYANLGVCHLGLLAHDKALACCEQALALKPDLMEAHVTLGAVRQAQGEWRQAREALAEARRLGAGDAVRIDRALSLPVIPASEAEIVQARATLETEVDALLEQNLSVADPVRHTTGPAFYLAYHGLNNRILHSKIARLYLRACPALSFTAAHCTRDARTPGPIRIGFISKFLHNHSIGKTTRGLLAKLSRDRFRVYALFVPPLQHDSIAQFIQQHADETLVLPHSLEQARQALAALELDVLFYQDIGMEPFTYFLAFSRLAPVQCVSFGHPDTTGIPTMDYWVSNGLFEPADAESHYSERLFLLRDLGTLAYYYRPQLPAVIKPPHAFGFPDDVHLYVCPQTLFKLHPQFDDILGGILRADPKGRVVLVEGRVAHWRRLLEARWARRIPDVVERIVFVPPQSSDDFLSLIRIADVMLDTPHFNGMNSNLEAFAVGTPVVTLPKEFQRGRHALGMYTRMGLADCIARSSDDYVAIAVRVATDREYRRHVHEQILSRSGVLFEDINVVREFERFFEEALAKTSHSSA